MATQNIKKTKRSTDEMISGAVDRQHSWLNNRRMFTRQFLRRFNVFHKPENETVKQNTKQQSRSTNQSVLRDYWFPIVCALLVILIAIVVVTVKINAPVKVVVPAVPEPVVKPVNTKNIQTVDEKSAPTFDVVRIDKKGQVVVAGRNTYESNISIVMNNKVVATEHTDKKGEFVYAPNNALKPGNYEIYLIDTDKNVKSADSVFLYVSESGYKNSFSLLMTEQGSKIMQSPRSLNGDLVVSKIDYLNTGRIVISGRALPRLRVSLTLNNKYLGFTRVSDYKNFGMGVDVDKLKSGEKYKLIIRLHDASGKTIAMKKQEFVMPESTGCEDTFYTVRRGDSLWVIARNFLRRGVLFSIIADCNDIKNPNLIYPDQVLHIPVK